MVLGRGAVVTAEDWTAIGTMTLALVTAITALQARSSARASRASSEATRAVLAEVFRPDVAVSLGGWNDEAGHHRGFKISNDSAHAALNVKWSVSYRDGAVHRGARETLGAGETILEGLVPISTVVEMTGPSFGVPMATATVEYEDLYGAERWTRRWEMRGPLPTEDTPVEAYPRWVMVMDSGAPGSRFR